VIRATRWRAAGVVLCLLAVGTARDASAQSTGGLLVLVEDTDGPLPGATVTIRNAERRIAEHSAISGGDGRVDFPVLPPGGAYAIEVSFPGYATVIVDDLRVRPGEHETLPVRLAEEYTETVRIVGERPVVDLEKSSSATKFSDDFIRDLPVTGRFYQNILTLAPGVQDANEDGNPNVHGSRSRDFRALVGGVANVDPLTGQYRANVNLDSIEEIEVITSGAGPEYGRAQGGFANIVLKQGSNRFEGVFDFIYRSDRFDGDGAGSIPEVRAPEFEWIQPSFQVSGPVVRDRLWYRLSHEWIDRDDPLNTTGSLEVVTTEQEIHSDQLTWQISDRNKLALRFESNPIKITNFGVSLLTPASAAQIRGFDADTWSLVWSAPYSPQLYVESTVAWQDGGLAIGPTEPDGRNSCVQGPELIESSQCVVVPGGATTGPYWRDFADHRQRWTVRSDATIYPGREFLAMDHQLKLGFIVENERYVRDIRDRARFDFYPLRPSLASGVLGYGQPQGTVLLDVSIPLEQRATADGATLGFYVKDTMRPRENVVVEVGARVEHEVIDSEGRSGFDPVAENQRYLDLVSQGESVARARTQTFTAYEGTAQIKQALASAFEIPPQLFGRFFGPVTNQAAFQAHTRRPVDIVIRNTNVSPFLAASWDPWSNGKSKLDVTAGRYYNNIPLIIPTWELAPATVGIAFESRLRDGVWTVESLGSQRTGFNPSASLYVVDRELSTPYQDELTLTVQREIRQETSLGVTLIRRRYREQFQDVDINHRPQDLGTCVEVRQPGDFPVDSSGGPDGILDDCIGSLYPSGIVDPFTGRGVLFPRPDGVPDLYTMNPFWGTINQIGNYNEADYDAVQLELVRRLYRGWELQGSYVWSRAKGNGEDFDQLLGNDQSLTDDEVGFQSNDQRHVLKIAGTRVTPWGIRLGGVVVWQSGLPYSILRQQLTYDAIAPELANFGGLDPRTRFVYPTGVRNDQRNTSYWNLDVKATREFVLGASMNLQLSLEIFDLLNEGTYIVYNQFQETGFQLNGENDAYRRFGRRFQLGFRLSF